MSWLLFLDESGHDHRTVPYEVRGGIALHASRLWSFVQEMQRLEYTSFGTMLHQFRTEIKGCKLLDKKRFEWALQCSLMPDEERQKYCRRFLTKGLEKKTPTRNEFTAYGQGCMEMAQGIFEILRNHEAKLFAAAIPASVCKPETFQAEEFLRKDHVFLMERYFFFLEEHQEHGLLVMDEVEKTEDRRFVHRLHSYFTKAHTGRIRSSWIVPSPFFVSSDMAYPVQAADLAIYCVNWGFRLPSRGMDAPVREEIEKIYFRWLSQLQYNARNNKDGELYQMYGVVYVPDPYTSR